ncbi:hypothetical protein CVT26_011983 [Gymnopilus dilepis]|uniref:F-box domain-containing protein n=1 Tax=Gymnopilus dilepis TaxID=231916 RepID=A0A409VYL0_9AGAR|nr:hypothetical protein CVT26_011983 [Gymnopilus dilepis]
MTSKENSHISRLVLKLRNRIQVRFRHPESLSGLVSPVPHLLETNHAPSDEERKKIVDFLPLAEERAREFQERLDKSSATSELFGFKDVRALCETEVFIRKHEASLSSIRILPNEILVLIFLACLPDVDSAPLCPAKWHTISSFRLSQVCQTWRDLAVHTPQLWVTLSGIFLHSSLPKKQAKSYLAFVQTVLTRSGDNELLVCISATPKYHPAWDPVLALLIQHQHRWAALGLCCGIGIVQALFEGRHSSSPVPHLSLPNLRRLGVDLLGNGADFATIDVARFSHLEEITILHMCSHLHVQLASKPLRVYKEVYGRQDDSWSGPMSTIRELGTGLEEIEVSTQSNMSFSQARVSNSEPLHNNGNPTFVTLENLTTLALRLYEEPSFITSILSAPRSSVIDGMFLPRLRVLKLSGPDHDTRLNSEEPSSTLSSLIPRLLPRDHLRRLHLKRVTLLQGELCSILTLTPNLEELIMDLPCEEDIEQLVVGSSDVIGVGSETHNSLMPKLKGLAFELTAHDVPRLLLRTNVRRVLLLLAPAIIAQQWESGQDDSAMAPYFRLILPDIHAARNVQLSFNMQDYHSADHSLGSEELDFTANNNLRHQIYLLKTKLRETIYEVVGRTKQAKSKKSRKNAFRSDFACDLNDLFVEVESLKLRQGRSIANLYITSLHLAVRYFSRLGENILPEDDKYMFRQRASRVLRRWDEIMLVDLRVRKLEWALKGQRSLVYLHESDGWHNLPQIKDATRKTLGVVFITALVIFTNFYSISNLKPRLSSRLQGLEEQNERTDTCTPQEYASGSWVHHPRTNSSMMTSPDDALRFSGFEKCASSREYYWHLAADKEEQYDRFPAAQSWKWVPGEGCDGLKPLEAGDLIKQLVEHGGWLLVGDSVTENHFFSLSCVLYPHVIATPDYTLNSNFDRAWPQNLYLSPSSPLIPSLKFSEGFQISTTPLVTFRRIDILFSKEELVSIHRSMQPEEERLNDARLFSEEAVWTLPLDEYMSEFFQPLPKANFATMIVSTGGHWTTALFSNTSQPGIEGVLALFEGAMDTWAQKVQQALWDANRPVDSRSLALKHEQARKRVVVRAYLPGHESCHDSRKPWTEVQPFVWNWYNWGEIWRFNAIFERMLSSKEKYPDIHFLPIDRPGRLRPDAHTTGDCLHIMTGAGVLEGWTQYIHHFVSHLQRQA